MEDYAFLVPLRPLLADPIVVSTVISAAETTDYSDAVWYVLRDVATRIDPKHAETISRLLLDLEITMDYRSILHLIKQDEREKRRLRPMSVICKLLVHLQPYWYCGGAAAAAAVTHTTPLNINLPDRAPVDFAAFREKIRTLPILDVKRWILYLTSTFVFSKQEFCRCNRITTRQFIHWLMHSDAGFIPSEFTNGYIYIADLLRKYLCGLFPSGIFSNGLIEVIISKPSALKTVNTAQPDTFTQAILQNTSAMRNITTELSSALSSSTVAEVRSAHSAFVQEVVDEHACGNLDAVIFIDGDQAIFALRDLHYMYEGTSVRIRAFVARSACASFKYARSWARFVTAPVTAKDSADSVLMMLMGEMHARLISDGGYVPFIVCSGDNIFFNAVEFMRLRGRRCGLVRIPHENAALYCLKFMRGRYNPAAMEVREYLRGVLDDYYITKPYVVDACCRDAYAQDPEDVPNILGVLRQRFSNNPQMFDEMSCDSRALIIRLIIKTETTIFTAE